TSITLFLYLLEPKGSFWFGAAFLGGMVTFLLWITTRLRAEAIHSARNAPEIVALRQEIADLSKKNLELVMDAARHAVLSWINETVLGSNEDYTTTLRRKLSFEGLAERMDARLFVQTSTKKALYEQMAQMPCGTIGIAGPRGAGKTTLLRSISDEIEAT